LEDQRKKKNKDKKGANNAIVFVQLETLASSKHYDFFFFSFSQGLLNPISSILQVF